ncbi:ATP synthase subunit I [Salinimonas lutimaris]|uniref:ATP synthase subunit I n=1 Tax=Salinimonas lutimaris TaxID=914153 RepID=UPI0010C0476B|nr:ATP synthase subunit I [Salinimonas lutimaris]
MVNGIARDGQRLAAKTIITQLCTGLFIALIFALFDGPKSGLYALTGAGICVIPSAVFALFAFRYAGARRNKEVVRSFRKGNAIKLMLTIVLFALAFRQTTVHVFPLFIGYIAALVAQWPALFIFTRTPKTRK